MGDFCDYRARESIGECRTCGGPIYRKTRRELVWESIAYEMVMQLPGWIVFETRFGKWLLPFAGNYAYSCSCPEKALP